MMMTTRSKEKKLEFPSCNKLIIAQSKATINDDREGDQIKMLQSSFGDYYIDFHTHFVPLNYYLSNIATRSRCSCRANSVDDDDDDDVLFRAVQAQSNLLILVVRIYSLSVISFSINEK